MIASASAPYEQCMNFQWYQSLDHWTTCEISLLDPSTTDVLPAERALMPTTVAMNHSRAILWDGCSTGDALLEGQ